MGDDFDGDTVVLVSNVGGRRDRHFARNYAWAKHAADRGRIDRIVVQVVANGERFRTIDAFKRAVGVPHEKARVFVSHTGKLEYALGVVDEVTAFMPLVDLAEQEAGESGKRGRRRGRRRGEPVDGDEVPAVVAGVDVFESDGSE